MELIPPSHSQNVERGRQDLLQEQFPDLHEFSEVQPKLKLYGPFFMDGVQLPQG